MLEIYQTGAQYQLVHSVVLLFIGLLALTKPELNKPLTTIGWLFTIGILIFSGSLYALALTGKTWFGAITPIGGLCFLAGWLYLAFTAGKLN